MTRRRRTLVAFVLAAGGALVAPVPAHAADDVSVTASVGDDALARSSDSRPVELRPADEAVLRYRVTNDGTAPLAVRAVRLRGEAMGLTFFSYEVSVDVRVPAGRTVERSLTLDLRGIEGQAAGLLRSNLEVVDADREVVASQRFIADVRGSGTSVYSLFGLALVVLTAITLVRAALALVRHQLSGNRFVRGLRVLVPGAGVGLVAVFTASAARAFSPRPGLAWTIVLVSAAAGFLVGYLTPTPDDELELDFGAAAAAPAVISLVDEERSEPVASGPVRPTFDAPPAT